MPTWERTAVVIFLALCLLVGILLGNWWAPRPLVGVLRFENIIDPVSATDMQRFVDGAIADPRLAAVVLEIYSPGGYATSSESIYYSLLQLRAAKPLVVVIDSLAASGGYYMAVAGNSIFAQASGYVGNVGTRGGRPVDPLLSPDELSSGPFKLMGGSRFDQIHQLDLVKDSFVGNVVHQRSQAAVNPLKIDAATVAEARIYLGSEALALGLIDYEGGRSDALAAAATLAGLTNYGVVELPAYLNLQFTPTANGLEQALQTLVAHAPPDTVWTLDSRIKLPATVNGNELDRQLLRLRAKHTTSLNSGAGSNRSQPFANLLPAPASKAQP